MAFPVYVPTRTVAIGSASLLASADPLTLQVIVTPSRGLIWDATGERFERSQVTVLGTVGTAVTMALPRTDVAGWRDEATGALIDVSVSGSYSHTYTALVSFLDAAGHSLGLASAIIGPFTLPAGDGSTVDLDKMLTAPTVAGGAVAVPDAWSGLVAAAQAAVAAMGGTYAPLASPAFTGTPTGITKAHVGLSNVNNTADSVKPVSTAQAAADAASVSTAAADATAKVAAEAALARNAANLAGTIDDARIANTIARVTDTRFGLDPDAFSGSDYNRVQSALDYSIANGFPALVFRRQFDITGAGPLSINKATYLDRRVINLLGHGGGITKTDAGAMVTSAIANMGDVSATGMRWVSTQGAGTTVWDCNQLIRISSLGCEYSGMDSIVLAGTGHFAQSLRFVEEHVIGGSGFAFQTPESYDMTIESCLFEDRTGGVFSNGADLGALQNRSLRIKDNVIEGFTGTGTPIILGSSWNVEVSGNYFEQNFPSAAGPQVDTYTLCATYGHYGLSIKNNMFSLSTYQIANSAAAVWIGGTAPGCAVVSESNVSTGILYDIKVATAMVSGLAGDRSTLPAVGPYQGNYRQLVYGDTGMRNIASLLEGGCTVYGDTNVYLSRVGSIVTLQLPITWPTWVSGTRVLNIPAGFRPYATIYLPASVYQGGAAVAWQLNSNGNLGLFSPTANAGSRYFWSWRTTDAWPTTLPGTALGAIPTY
jgi:hypothetical protein